MCWVVTLFRDQVVLRYLVILIGWPPEIPFCDLSTAGAPTAQQMRKLLKLITTRKLYFARATPGQLRIAGLAAGGIAPGPLCHKALPHPNLGRSDIGRQKAKYDSEGNAVVPRYVRDGPKSAKMVEEVEEDTAETHTQLRTSGPLPQIRNSLAHMGWYPSGWRDLSSDPDYDSTPSDDISEFTDG